MLHKFFTGFKSCENGGHIFIFSFFMPNLARDSVVYLAAWDGALTCRNIMFRLNATPFFLYHGIALFWETLHVLPNSFFPYPELWKDQLARQQCFLPKTSLLCPFVDVWAYKVLENQLPYSTPPIRAIKRGTALFREKGCFKICLLSPSQPFDLVSAIQQ